MDPGRGASGPGVHDAVESGPLRQLGRSVTAHGPVLGLPLGGHPIVALGSRLASCSVKGPNGASTAFPHSEPDTETSRRLSFKSVASPTTSPAARPGGPRKHRPTYYRAAPSSGDAGGCPPRRPAPSVSGAVRSRPDFKLWRQLESILVPLASGPSPEWDTRGTYDQIGPGWNRCASMTANLVPMRRADMIKIESRFAERVLFKVANNIK